MPSTLDAAAHAVCECPHCHRELRIRLAFADRRALCRACRTPFLVPSREDLVDHTASRLIAQGVDAEFRSRSRRAAAIAQRPRQAEPEELSASADPFALLGAR